MEGSSALSKEGGTARPVRRHVSGLQFPKTTRVSTLDRGSANEVAERRLIGQRGSQWSSVAVRPQAHVSDHWDHPCGLVPANKRTIPKLPALPAGRNQQALADLEVRRTARRQGIPQCSVGKVPDPRKSSLAGGEVHGSCVAGSNSELLDPDACGAARTSL